MKKWTGGTLILILTLILFLRYSLSPSLPLPKIKALIPSSPPLPGLNELITPNFTHLTPNPNLIWPHILPVLSRPDALPATADAVKEASIAWRDLIASIRAEKDANLSSEKRKVCPFSVSGNGSGVEIPCGLVQDSAVTVVGVPVARNGSSRFGFELVGDGNGVVVRVNVSIEGDEVVIGQSSKRADSRWGEWEMCPVHGVSANSSNLKGNFLWILL